MVLIILAIVLSFGLGYVFSPRNERCQMGEKAMGVFMNELAVLQYLENGDDKRAKSMLINLLDADLVEIMNYGTPELDSQYPGEKQKYFARFDQLKKAIQGHATTKPDQ